MKKSLFCLLLASLMALSACGGMGGSQPSASSDNSSVLDNSVSDDSSTPDDSSVADSSSSDEVVKGEKVADENAWNSAIEESCENYTLTGRIWFDNTICDAVICIENLKGKCSLSVIQSTEDGAFINEFLETGGMAINGVVYGYEKIDDVPIDDLTDVIWEPSFFVSDKVQPTPNSASVTEQPSDDEKDWFENYWFEGYYNKLIFELCEYSKFTYDETIGTYFYNEEECTIKIWFDNGKVKKLECENVGFIETDGGQMLVHWATVIFGETKVEFDSYPNVETKGEKVADENAWAAAFEAVSNNYTANGVQIFDGEAEELLVKVDGSKSMVTIGSQDGEEIIDYGAFIDGNLYHYNENTMLWEERNDDKSDWNQFIGLADNVLSLLEYSDFSYDEESGIYKAVKTYGVEMTFYVKIEDGKAKNVKYSAPYGGEEMWLKFVFGETEIELPAGLPES